MRWVSFGVSAVAGLGLITGASRAASGPPAVAYASYVGADDWDTGHAAAVDKEGNAYLLSTAVLARGNGGKDALVMKLSPSGQLVYASIVGGSRDEIANDIAVDEDGRAHITGLTYSEDNPFNHEDVPFPTTPDAYQTEYARGFLSVLSPDGDSLVYSTCIDVNEARAIALDDRGAIYITGDAGRFGFPATSGAFQEKSSNTLFGEAFVAKLNPKKPGKAGLAYATYLSGTGEGKGYDIAVDGGGSAFIVGNASGGFPVTANAYQKEYGGTSSDGDAFVAKLDPTGSRLLYSTYLGTSFYDDAKGVALDAAGHPYVVGTTYFSGFPTTPGVFQPNWVFGGECGTVDRPNRPCADAFVAKLDTEKSGPASLIYSTYLGGRGHDHGGKIAADADGNAYVTGMSGSYSDFPATDPIQEAYGGGSDAFLTKISPDGSRVLFSTFFGGEEQDSGEGIALDRQGGAVVVGSTYSGRLPVKAALQEQFGGRQDAFVVRITLEDGATEDPGSARGDVNANGQVDVTDATLTLRFVVSAATLNDTQVKSADVDGDGMVTVRDVTRILRKAVGLPANF